MSHPLPLAAAAERRRGKPGRPRKATAPDLQLSKPETIARLLDLDACAHYLSVSGWTVRDLEGSGVLRRVRIPLPRGGELRKVLFDRADLDQLIKTWKDSAR